MRTLISDWNFHKAGQGLFYSGTIKSHGNNSFWFVYDCGTVQGAAILKSQIRDFNDSMAMAGKKELDLLVISHFDADHINHVHLLLQNISCKLVVLPYMSAIERFELYFRQGFDEVTDDEDYSDLFFRPDSIFNSIGG